jgi:hypothetical protein
LGCATASIDDDAANGTAIIDDDAASGTAIIDDDTACAGCACGVEVAAGTEPVSNGAATGIECGSGGVGRRGERTAAIDCDRAGDGGGGGSAAAIGCDRAGGGGGGSAAARGDAGAMPCIVVAGVRPAGVGATGVTGASRPCIAASPLGVPFAERSRRGNAGVAFGGAKVTGAAFGGAKITGAAFGGAKRMSSEGSGGSGFADASRSSISFTAVDSFFAMCGSISSRERRRQDYELARPAQADSFTRLPFSLSSESTYETNSRSKPVHDSIACRATSCHLL